MNCEFDDKGRDIEAGGMEPFSKQRKELFKELLRN